MRFASLVTASAGAAPTPFAVRPGADDAAGLGVDPAATAFGVGSTGGDAALRAGGSAAVRGLAAPGDGTAGLAGFTVAVAGGAGGFVTVLDDGAVAAGFAATPDGELAAGAAGLAAAGIDSGGAADGLAGLGATRAGAGRKGTVPRSPPFGGFDTVTADNPLLPNA
jgi:hypothetical protein